ncbi:MAG: hypothetical protein M3461_23330 [Pseudomonadota bacterium]|nr:hypothetical protein [Pseudomonadota bacterium]
MPRIYKCHSTGTGFGWELTGLEAGSTAALLCGTLGLQSNEVVRGAMPSGLEAQGRGGAGEASPISEIPDPRIRSDVAAMKFSRSADLPGGDLIEEGLDDLRQHRQTVAALLVSIGAPRLRQLGLRVPRTESDPERCLYELLARSDPDRRTVVTTRWYGAS